MWRVACSWAILYLIYHCRVLTRVSAIKAHLFGGMQASPDRAYGARVAAVDREVRGEQAKKLGVRVRFSKILTFSVLLPRFHPKGPPQEKQ